jgi:1-acyl-sn-glycerol-3-phosphate acyltransferase
MRYVRRFRLLLSVILFVPMAAAFGSFDLYANLLWGKLLGETALMRRERIARWQARWSHFWLLLHRKIGGVRLTCILDASPKRARGPFIVIANHFGIIDGMIIAHVLRRLGNDDYRVVAKDEVGRIPLVGRAFRELGAAFVKRDHRPDDADAVSHLGKIACEDGANAVIFVEGTVLTAATATNGARTILPPHHRGFQRLVRAAPGREFLSFTTFWRDWDPHFLSDQGLLSPGTDALIECRVLPPLPLDADDATIDAFLNDEWQHKAAWLRAAE